MISIIEIVQQEGERTAIVQVDSTIYEVRAGETFAGRFRLLSFDGSSCAEFLFGDQRFRQCEGERSLK